MKFFTRVLFGIAMLYLSSCGKQHEDNGPSAPAPQATTSDAGSTAPYAQPVPNPSAPQLPPAPANIPLGTTAPVPNEPTQILPIMDTEIVNQADYASVDSSGLAFAPQSPVPMDPAFSPGIASQFNPQAPTYFNELQVYSVNLAKPYPVYAEECNRPYLAPRYDQYRALLNYDQSFRQVERGKGPWNDRNYRQMQTNLELARRWVNYDAYNLMNRTMAALSQRKYRSSGKFDEQMKRAIDRRDHQSAVHFHDQLLDEYRKADHHSDPRSTNPRRG